MVLFPFAICKRSPVTQARNSVVGYSQTIRTIFLLLLCEPRASHVKRVRTPTRGIVVYYDDTFHHSSYDHIDLI